MTGGSASIAKIANTTANLFIVFPRAPLVTQLWREDYRNLGMIFGEAGNDQ